MLAALWTEAYGWFRVILVALAVTSLAFTLIAVSTNPMPLQLWPTPLGSILWPAFQAGRIPIPGPERSNLGRALGLHGQASLLPLLGIWAVAAGLWFCLPHRGVRAADASS